MAHAGCREKWGCVGGMEKNMEATKLLRRVEGLGCRDMSPMEKKMQNEGLCSGL